MLSDLELNRIIQWLPYRDDWPIDRNQIDDGISENYGALITQFKTSKVFNLYIDQNGGMSNYLAFLCYPPNSIHYSGTGILVFINLCAPVATYGETDCTISTGYYGHSSILAENNGIITLPALKDIENEILKIFSTNKIFVLEQDFLVRKLPKETIDKIDFLLGDQYIHGIFQMAD